MAHYYGRPRCVVAVLEPPTSHNKASHEFLCLTKNLPIDHYPSNNMIYLQVLAISVYLLLL